MCREEWDIMLYARCWGIWVGRWVGWGGNHVRLRHCYRLLVLMMNGWMYVVERVGWLYDSLARLVLCTWVLSSESWSAVHIAP